MSHQMLRHILFPAALIAGLVLMPPVGAAQNAAAALIQPKGGWAVTRIEDAAIQGGAYCALARQYQNDVIFSIGRNQAEEYSLAIDFQTNKLDTDKPYKVTLKAGKNQTRAVEIMAASPRALVVRLGWDDSFFEALEKSEEFSLAFNEEKYVFAVTGYQKGKADLQTCMDSLKNTAPQGGSDVLAAESGIGGTDFSARKTAADTAAESTGEEPAPAPDITRRPEQTRISALNTPAVPGLNAGDKAAYVAPMRSTDLETLEAENARLRDALDEQRRAYEAKASSADQTNKIAELEEKLRLAEMKAGQAQPVAAQADPAQAQRVAELEKQVASLQKDLAQAHDVKMKAAPTPLPNPEQAALIADLQAEVGALKEARKTDAAHITGLEKKLAAAAQAPAPVAVAVPPAPKAEPKPAPQTLAKALEPVEPAPPPPPVEKKQDGMKLAASNLQPILARVGITARPARNPPPSVLDAYEWQAGPIRGRAHALEGRGSARDISQTYANAQRQACGGDFASVPGAVQGDGLVTLDIACVDAKGGTAQSLLFAQQGGQVLSFIFETPADNMDRAMDMRDRLSTRL